MVAFVQQGIHFNNPWLMTPMTAAAANITFYDTAAAANASSTVAFFTGVSSYGVIDTTNWAANTYKTIYNHTGMGLIGGMIACTAGGAETTTFEITIDGLKSEITVTNANGERAMLLATGPNSTSDFTTAATASKPLDGGLDSGTLTTLQTSSMTVTPLRWQGLFGIPLLRYNNSCLVRMKHSAIITNSTATAYSGVWVRKGIAA